MMHVEFGESGQATLFLHGFPGVRSKQNRDLAMKASSYGPRRSYVPLYDGLGQAPGTFSFLKCRSDVEAFASKLLQDNASIDLVGHSWGGYLALGLASRHQKKIRRLVLMSPLLHFFTLDLARQAFRLTAQDQPALSLGDTDALAKEFHALGTRETAEDFARSISTETSVSIFQAADDTTTPPSYAQNLVNCFALRPSYEEVATDHSFLFRRESALERVLTALDETSSPRLT